MKILILSLSVLALSFSACQRKDTDESVDGPIPTNLPFDVPASKALNNDQLKDLHAKLDGMSQIPMGSYVWQKEGDQKVTSDRERSEKVQKLSAQGQKFLADIAGQCSIQNPQVTSDLGNNTIRQGLVVNSTITSSIHAPATAGASGCPTLIDSQSKHALRYERLNSANKAASGSFTGTQSLSVVVNSSEMASIAGFNNVQIQASTTGVFEKVGVLSNYYNKVTAQGTLSTLHDGSVPMTMTIRKVSFTNTKDLSSDEQILTVTRIQMPTYEAVLTTWARRVNGEQVSFKSNLNGVELTDVGAASTFNPSFDVDLSQD